MSDTTRFRGDFRLWLPLLLTAFLLCGFLTGCGHGREARSDDESQPDSTSVEANRETGRDNDIFPAQPSPAENSEESVETSDTLQDFQDTIATWNAEPGENAKADTNGPLYKLYSDIVTGLKETAGELEADDLSRTETLVDNIALLGDIGAKLDILENMTARGSALLIAFPNIQPAPEELSEQKAKAEEWRKTLAQTLTGSDPLPAPNAPDYTELQKGIEDLQQDISALRESVDEVQGAGTKGTGGLFSIIGILCSLACLLLIAVAILMIRGQSEEYHRLADKMSKAVKTETDHSQGDGSSELTQRTLREYVERTQDLQRNLNTFLSILKQQKTPGAAPVQPPAYNVISTPPAPNKPEEKTLTFQIDNTKGGIMNQDAWLKESPRPGQFSGTPSGVDLYDIWPDPWPLGYLPNLHRELKEISVKDLYFGYVSKCFAIEPKEPGNYASFRIQLEKYATVQKTPSGYKLISPGKISAKGMDY